MPLLWSKVWLEDATGYSWTRAHWQRIAFLHDMWKDFYDQMAAVKAYKGMYPNYSFNKTYSNTVSINFFWVKGCRIRFS